MIGSGPNGLTAGIELARAGWSVTIYEAAASIGGGTRTAQLTRPGYLHDVCSAVHPLAASSPAFGRYPLHEYGLEWVHPPLPLAHPFDDGGAAVLARSFDETADSLGGDGAAWLRLVRPLVQEWESLVSDLLRPFRVPGHVFSAARFARSGLGSASGLSNRRFDGRRARGLFGGLAAHAIMPLERWPTAAFGLILAAAGHAVGWPLAREGSHSITRALAGYLESLGGTIVKNHEVRRIEELPQRTVTLLDLTPRQIVRIVGGRLPGRYRRALERYRYGCGVFKMDWALSEPVPWTAEPLRRAGTIHLGGELTEIEASERDAWEGRVSECPFVIVAQPSLFDETRAPKDRHTLWAYCHVPAGNAADQTEAIEGQIERFAPGFRDVILARHTFSAPELEAYNPNFVGGDINGGVQDLRQLFTRPVVRLDPYSMPVKGLYVCSSATPPGGGVHGLCGYFAAQSVLRH